MVVTTVTMTMFLVKWELTVMHPTTWEGVIQWVGKYMERLVQWSCDQVWAKIVARGDKEQWQASFDGFYLTHDHHSNNASATLHDVQTNSIAWFAHHTKKGKRKTGGGGGDVFWVHRGKVFYEFDKMKK